MESKEEQKKIYKSELQDDDIIMEKVVAKDDDMEELYRDENSREQELENLKDMLKEDPYNVLLYQQVIEHYKLNIPEMVRATRQRACEKVTLSLDMWKEWIDYKKSKQQHLLRG